MPDGRWKLGVLMKMLLLNDGDRKGIGRRSARTRDEGPTG
jgi:hypothetical protein